MIDKLENEEKLRLRKDITKQFNIKIKPCLGMGAAADTAFIRDMHRRCNYVTLRGAPQQHATVEQLKAKLDYIKAMAVEEW